MIQKEELNDIDRLYSYFYEEKTIGYLEVRVIDRVVDIININVLPEFRRKGIATALLNYMFKNEDYDRIMLEVNEKNSAAIKLYTELGFKEISIRDRYYNNDSAIIMEKLKK